MSDHIVKIIPADPCYHPDSEKTHKIVDYLESKIKADRIDVTVYETPAFIDCGSNLESITCPLCGAALDFDWWGEVMGAAADGGFMNLSVTLPCCKKESTLNDLRYYFPCGFSSVVFQILNPLDEPEQECLTYIQGILGCPVHLIQAHI